MPPKKKAEKMSLNAFLGDSALGSWADEMDAIPTAPSGEPAERSRLSNAPDRGPRGDFHSDRPPREDLPLPTAPPYTAFIGNLPFDITEDDLGVFFGSHETKSVKIIRDREDRPKGFGYIEFVELEGLKDALSKSGSNFSGRTVRISVAEPPKERSGPGGGSGLDDEKFAGNWRREGPLPDLPDSRDPSRRRYDSDRGPPQSSISDSAGDWRSTTRPIRTGSGDTDMPPPRQKRTNFGDSSSGAADTEETWTKGSKFRPSTAEDGQVGRFGAGNKRQTDPAPDESDWRKPSRPISRGSHESAPPTPMRRKLELLPKSSGSSTVTSPQSSPNPATGLSRSNPFGAAKPVDVSAKEAAIAERLEKDKDRLTHTMSRTSSRNASERPSPRSMGPPGDTSSPAGPALSSNPPSVAVSPRAASATVRPAISFAAVARKDGESKDETIIVEEVTKQVTETQI